MSLENSDDSLKLEALLENIDDDIRVVLYDWAKFKNSESKKCEPKNFQFVTSTKFYFKKFLGAGRPSLEREDVREIFLSFIGSFLSVAILGVIDFYFLHETKFVMLIPGFGAMAVILFTRIGSRGFMAQPRNAFFGHVLSAVIGVACQTVIRSEKLVWISGALSVSITLAAMSLTNTVHPAAGATALACVYGGPAIINSGWWFVLVPVASGSVFIILVAVLINNLSPRRRYPSYWC